MNRHFKVAYCIAFVFGMLFAASAFAEGPELATANIRLDSTASLQRGARLYFNYCSGCHSLKYMRYSRIGADLKLSDDEVKQNFIFTDAKIGDLAESNMPADKAAKFFGKDPPDLSLEARARGTDWIYNYLKSFYLDPSRPTGWNNSVFPNASMPDPLWELQGVQRAEMTAAKPGEEAQIERLELVSPGKLSPHQFDDSVRDLVAFLAYVGEPAALKRESIGVWVILYLAFFTFLAWLLKHEYWKDVK
ncbi:MAG: cytochrome c1 [Rudaea sp.]